ncbi:ABC transporter permease [Anaeromicropila herbilytica]|uniref:Sodium ABC transporter n=1 Tax=Anaeromicropila herbilytica TaxID=2785025 RepID=A0A7R7EHK2_9FIRM|nr:ABC transporter permease [Anaeromicropila herbilytica]BCN28976.1 sodium ABC transporter [Anaeromicropila herbilytica]
MNGIKTIVAKELSRVFSDKKLVVSLFILPVVLIIGIYALMGQLASNQEADIEKHVPIIAIQNEPEGFADFMKSISFNGKIKTIESDSDIKAYKDGILKGKKDVLVVFDQGFLDSITNYKDGDKIPEVKTYYNPSEDYSQSARTEFVDTVLASYKQQLLQQRFGNLESLSVFNVDVNSDSSVIMNEDKASGKVLGSLLPYLITFMLFASAMSLGVDAITGEKERGTLASMLITPIKRRDIVLGKLISLSILSMLSAAVYAVGMIVAFPMMMKNMSDSADLGLTMSFSAVQIIELLAIMLTLVFLYVGLVAGVAVFARTAKEATTYVTPIYIIVLVAGMITMVSSGTPDSYYFAIPVYGSALSIQGLLTGDLTTVQLAFALLSNVGLGAILTAVISSAFNNEKVMFNA